MKITLLKQLLKTNKDAEGLIRSGNVMVNNEVVFIPSTKINETDNIKVKEQKEWVSRGAYKLISAIEMFKLDFKNKVILDIGSSTGGFTQVALAHGAKFVNALDVGTNQLEYSLRVNKQVQVFEKTNLKTILPSMFKDKIDVIVTDVSFISLKYVFNVCKDLEPEFIMALIKPQFEANSDQIITGGIAPQEIHEDIINKVKGYAEANDFILLGYHESPIKGAKSKNTEYISLFKRK